MGSKRIARSRQSVIRADRAISDDRAPEIHVFICLGIIGQILLFWYVPCYIAKALLHGRDSNMLRRACYGRATTYCKLGLGVAIGSRDNVCVARLAMLLPCCYMRALFGNVAKAKITMVLLFGTARQSSLASAQCLAILYESQAQWRRGLSLPLPVALPG